MHPGLTLITHSPEETLALGQALASVLAPGDVISLGGDLGAGKTVFVKGVAAGLDVTSPVTSPSFALVNEHAGRHRLVHVDVYRLDSIQEVLDLGFEELLDPSAVVVIEWGTAVAPLLPAELLDIEVQRSPDLDAEQDRIILFRPRGSGWADRIEVLSGRAESPSSAHDSSVRRGGEATGAVARDDGMDERQVGET
ncbi:hypothetical protein BH18ACT15_BH18ACT15_14220 [soil metagenome]